MTPMLLAPSDLAANAHCLLKRLDPRLLVPLVIALGLLSWLLPWPWLGLFAVPALGLYALALRQVPAMRGFLRAYVVFALFWGASFFLLQIWDKPGSLSLHVFGALTFSLRLFCLLGYALAIALGSTPLTVGRVLTWYLARLGKAEYTVRALSRRVFCRPTDSPPRSFLADDGWKAGLALAVMMAFLPRVWSTMRSLRLSLRLRAPRLPLHRRMSLLALAAIRSLGTQTWDMTLSIASRDLYRPEPWQWPSPVRVFPTCQTSQELQKDSQKRTSNIP